MINREEEAARLAAGEEEIEDRWGGRKSRSQKKREAHGLTDLGERLTELKPHEINALPMDDELRAAVLECQRLTKNARSRQLRLIGKLLRSRDVQELTDKLEGAAETRRKENAVEQGNENWRRRLLEEGDAVLTEFLEAYPAVDVAELRSSIRQFKQLKTGARATRASREVLRLVRAVRAAAAAEAAAAEDDDQAGGEA